MSEHDEYRALLDDIARTECATKEARERLTDTREEFEAACDASAAAWESLRRFNEKAIAARIETNMAAFAAMRPAGWPEGTSTHKT